VGAEAKDCFPPCPSCRYWNWASLRSTGGDRIKCCQTMENQRLRARQSPDTDSSPGSGVENPRRNFVIVVVAVDADAVAEVCRKRHDFRTTWSATWPVSGHSIWPAERKISESG
jgi:hypothetical protein